MMSKPVAFRILDNVAKDATTGCWNWKGATTLGYGRIRVEGRLDMTHRVAYRLWTGDLIPGMQIDHLCSNRACCNPDHLEQVTPIVNRLRASPRATHCGKGHDMAVDRYPGGGCRACCKIRNEAWRDRRRQLRAAA